MKEVESPIVIYQDVDHAVEVRLDTHRDTVWLSLQQLAELFERDKSFISRHLRNIFNEGELEKEATVAKNATVRGDGLASLFGNLEQSVFGEPAYPSVESKAAHLLYSVVIFFSFTFPAFQLPATLEGEIAEGRKEQEGMQG